MTAVITKLINQPFISSLPVSYRRVAPGGGTYVRTPARRPYYDKLCSR